MEKRESLVPQWPCGRLASLKKVNFFRTPSQSAKVEEEDKEGKGKGGWGGTVDPQGLWEYKLGKGAGQERR